MITKTFVCDRCGHEVEHPRHLKVPEASMKRDLCADCVEALRLWLRGTHTNETITIYEVSERELQEVYRRGAEALEAWALGASADELAQHIRDMLSHARRETNGQEEPRTLLGVRV